MFTGRWPRELCAVLLGSGTNRSRAHVMLIGWAQGKCGSAVTRNRPRVVIVGAGFGGLMAARGLARAPVDILVIDRHNYHLFQPLLYQVATAALSPADIAEPIR